MQLILSSIAKQVIIFLRVDHKDNLKSYWGADREIAKSK